jgi:hypothetical protein
LTSIKLAQDFWAVLEVWEPLLVGCVADAGERLVESKLLEWLCFDHVP